jgi:hypothetical protein
LFDFAPEFQSEITIENALKVFGSPPKTPEEAFYAETPQETLNARVEPDAVVVVKQVHTTSYWRTIDTVTEGRIQTIRREQIDRRAVNLLRIENSRRRAELRLSRLGADESDKQVAIRFETLLTVFTKLLDIRTTFIPVPIWDAYHLIAIDRDHTLMRWDSPQGSEHAVRFMARRQHGAHFWDDIRDSPDYPKSEPAYARDELRIYWVRGSGEDKEALETRLSDIKLKPMRYGKVEIVEVLKPDDVTYVLGRIRTFVKDASS